MWLVAIIDNGAMVKINRSLLLFDEIAKITIAIKKETITFLKEEFNNNGLLEREANIEVTKNKATVK